MSSLLEIKNLSTFFYIEEGVVQSVRNVDLKIERGETLALVGESGCGKSVTALSVLRLVPTPPGKFETGNILFDGQDIFSKTEKQMEHLRGNDISMIFQEPMTSLNPIFTIGDQIAEVPPGDEVVENEINSDVVTGPKGPDSSDGKRAQLRH